MARTAVPIIGADEGPDPGMDRCRALTLICSVGGGVIRRWCDGGLAGSESGGLRAPGTPGMGGDSRLPSTGEANVMQWRWANVVIRVRVNASR